jgi:UDP-glucose 4-epimerase
MTPKTIFVTGPAGFIGSNFVSQFKKQFPETVIVGIDNFSTGRRDALDKNMTFYEGSICDRGLVKKIFAEHRPEFVFHFAALPRVSYSVENPVETTEVNILGTVILLNAAREHGVKRFIYSSSSALYGGADKLPTKESECPPAPQSPYAVQKYAGEPFCRIFSELYGLDTVSLRYFNVFGPGQYGDSPYSTVISAWLETLYFPKNKKPFLEGDGKQSRDFCYIDNVVQANIKAMLIPGKLKGVAFNVAHGERTDLLEVKKLIEKHTGKILDYEKRPPRLGDVLHTHADIGLAKKLIGYEPTVNFEEGLKRTVAWFEERSN